MISVIIPCYNYARFLADAIGSVEEQRVNGELVEILVVDDGSIDDTAAVAGRFGDRVRYHYQANAGLSAARNTGLKLASHELVFLLDSDDMVMPGALAELWTVRQGIDPAPAVLASRNVMMDAAGTVQGQVEPGTGAWRWIAARELVIRNRFAPGVLAARGTLLSMGGFDPGLRACEDRDMWIRVAAKHPVAWLDRPVLMKREHGSNLSSQAAHQTACIRRVLSKAQENGDLNLEANTWKLAESVCCYQSALMYADSGDFAMAIRQLAQSFATWPVAFPSQEAALAPFGRLRALGGVIRRAVWR